MRSLQRLAPITQRVSRHPRGTRSSTAAQMAGKTPNVLWAQRPNCVFLTIDVQDVKDPKLELANEEDGKHAKLSFAGAAADGTAYALDLELYGAVDKDASKFNTIPRHIFLVLEKAEAGSWPRLTKGPSKGDKHIKVDWDKWVDSDEEPEDDIDMSGMGGMPGMDMGGMGGMDIQKLLAQMGGGAGMGGMGGGEEGEGGSDSDDDELPPLEAAGAAAGADGGADAPPAAAE
ncbi:MAG: putative Hsp90 binding co-chaperone [Monoraphidium minutum]|nr:MAG: putative Hsp90 binding co-chaperone [Monoraphidium minutum]